MVDDCHRLRGCAPVPLVLRYAFTFPIYGLYVHDLPTTLYRTLALPRWITVCVRWLASRWLRQLTLVEQPVTLQVTVGVPGCRLPITTFITLPVYYG